MNGTPTFTNSNFGFGIAGIHKPCLVDRHAGQSQSAITQCPVLAATEFPFQPGTLIAASAGIFGQSPTALAGMRCFDQTRPEITWRALVSHQHAH